MGNTKWVVSPKVSDDLEEQLLANRDIKDAKAFFNPILSPQPIVDQKQLDIAVSRIRKAIQDQESVYIYGDFDVDGVTATAVLWESLDKLGAKVMPYIPHREKEGYGLSDAGLKELKEKGGILVISVDCGISAVEQSKLAKKLGLELIITDHHQRGDSDPEALAILHTYELCGVGVAYELAEALYKYYDQPLPKELLDLVALGTISDMVPLIGKNRALVKFGLEQLNQTKRLGLKEIIRSAGIDQKQLGVFEVGFVIAPRLNAMGRLEHAYDSLRTLLTRDPNRAQELASKLTLTNMERQRITKETLIHANQILDAEGKDNKIFVLYHETWQQGVVGLVAGRLTDKYCRPVLVISKGATESKGSARSINGFNIVEAIRSCSDILINCGGHPAAAGFTIPTNKIDEFKNRLNDWAKSRLDDTNLIPIIKIDAELPEKLITDATFNQVQKFAPFGMSNPEPVFCTNNLLIRSLRTIGDDNKHLKLYLKSVSGPGDIEAIGFGLGSRISELQLGMGVNVAYTLTVDAWNGKSRIVLKLRDFHPSTNYIVPTKNL